jgi:hypothetical protein
MAVVATLSQGCFNLDRHVPIDGERAVEVKGHDAAIDNQNTRSGFSFRLAKDSRFRPPQS